MSIGRTYLALNDFDAALQSFQQAVEIDPQNGEAYYRVGRAFYERGQHNKAATYLKQAVEFDPNYGPAYGYLAFTYWSRRNYEEAIPRLEKAIAFDSIAARKRAQSFRLTVENRLGELHDLPTDGVMAGEFLPLVEDVYTLEALLTPTSGDDAWQDARGKVTLDTQSGIYTVTLEALPQVRSDQAYIGWFEGIKALSGDPLKTAPLDVDATGAVVASSETGWVAGPRIEYFYTLGLAYFYLDECGKAYPLFEAALQIDPEEQNAIQGIQLCQDVE
jgi:tetratricopeptide (TPR) repeat protein